MRMSCSGLTPAAIALLLAAGCAAGPRTGARREGGFPYPFKEPPRAEDIYHLPTGLKLTVEGAMEIVSGARLVYVGETHDNLHAHRVELLVLRSLFQRFPGKVAVGMEMFREPQQEALDRWTKGELTEAEFLKAAKWYSNWGSDYGNYREILDFARENRIDVVALNPSKDIEQEVKARGLDNVSRETQAKLPDLGETDPYQYEMLKALYGAHLPSEGMFDSFFRVQMLWEETMAERIVSYLQSPRGEGNRMVVITGGWHSRYGFGVPKKVLRRSPMPYAIVSPEEIEIPAEKADQLMNVDLPDIPLLPADIVWMVPYEDVEKDRVRMGVRLSEKDGAVRVDKVEEGSAAAKAGMPEGCEIVSFDGQPVRDMADVFILMGAKRSGDVAVLVVRKDGLEQKLSLTFFGKETAR